MKMARGLLLVTLYVLFAGPAFAQNNSSNAAALNSPYGALLEHSIRPPAGEVDPREVQKQLSANTKIVKGQPVALGKYPWMAAIGYFAGPSFVRYCGGTVIAPRWVLTAAHCPVQKNDGVVVNAVNLTDVKASARVLRIIAPSYNKTTRDMDFALLELDTALQVQTLSLSRDPAFETADNQKFVIAGWGRTERGVGSIVLLDAPITTVGMDLCTRKYKVVPLSLTASMFCGSSDRGDACQGDSGGPAMRQVGDNRYVLVGLVSWGKECGQKAFPGVYTRASQIADAVEQIIKSPPPSASEPSPNAHPIADASGQERVAAVIGHAGGH